MIEGVVNAHHEAVITLTLRGPAGQVQDVAAVVDTGFNRSLTLPLDLVAELGLPLLGRSPLVLANGSQETFDVYGVTVLWDGQPKYVETYVADATPLVGMFLLDSHSLYVEVADGGRVLVQAIE